MTTATEVVNRYKAAYRGKFWTPRSSYLPPEARDKDPYVPDGTDLAVWKYEKPTPGGTGTLYYAIAFVANQNKPLFHYRYPNEAARDQSIEKAAKDRRDTLERKQKKQQERREFKHEFNVGDILYTSWGYDQTNCSFFEVTKILGPKAVEIRELAQATDHSERGADYVVPIPGRYARHSQLMRKMVAPGNRVKIESYAHAHKWDGKPKYQTSALYGH